MDIQDLQTLVERRHSIRGYDESREISDETVQSILDCALGADGGNGAWFGFAVLGP
jgi:nitroreductase